MIAQACQAIAVLALAQFSAAALADVYKCEAPGQKTEYRPTPCERGTGKVIKTPVPSLAGAAGSAEPRTSPQALARGLREVEARGSSLDDPMSIDLPDTPLSSVLQIVADFSGKQLVFTSKLPESGSFKYRNMPARAVLMDLAQRYRFQIQFVGQKVMVGRR